MMLTATNAIHEVSLSRSYCSAEQYDSDLGLYYLRARYYNPATGRFLSRDPEDGTPLIPITLHKYIYAGSNPTNWIDPSGRDIIEDVLVLEDKTQTAVEFANTVGCYANIGLAAVTTLLAEKFDYKTALGAASTIYGCVTISSSPAGKALKLAKTAADLGACVITAGLAISDVNDYLNNASDAAEGTFVADFIGSVLTCGITGLGAALEP